MKLNKYLSLKLEQFYNSTLEEPQGWADSAEQDVPNIKSDKKYQTFMIFPTLEDIEEPVLKTKKGKNILREPPGDPDAEPEDIDVDMLDSKGREIDDWEEDEEQIVSEANEEDEDTNPNLSNQDMNTEQNPEMGMDPNANISDPSQQVMSPETMTGGDPTGGMNTGSGMGYEPPKTSEQIGRIFELKKIYSRLLSIEAQLSFSADLTLVKLRKYISQAAEFFEIVIANESSFKDEMDEIIVKYYNFLDQVYHIIKHYYAKQDKKEKA